VFARARSLEDYTQDLFTYPDEDSVVIREARSLATKMKEMIHSQECDGNLLASIIPRLRYIYDLVLRERKARLSKEVLVQQVLHSDEMQEFVTYLGTLETTATQEELTQEYQKCLDAAFQG
jgi:hypothetical protein